MVSQTTLTRKMKPIFFLFLVLATFICPNDGQYSPDEFDPVEGAPIADCLFHGDRTVDCTGRLRCHPSDVRDRTTIAQLDRICPREPAARSGTWDNNQVIPASAMRNAGTGRVARCNFFANHGEGSFKCTGTNGDTWKGTYTGTMNTAFGLGLPRSGLGVSGAQDTYPIGSSSYGDDDSSYPAGSGSYRFTTESPYSYGSGSGYNRRTTPYYSSFGRTPLYDPRDRYNNPTARDNYFATTRGYGHNSYDGGSGRYGTGLGLGGDRDTYRDPLTSGSRDRFNTDRDSDSTYPVAGTSQITMCTYKSDGSGKCRDCTERVDRQETASEIRTTRHYTCSGPETSTSWTENNGIIPAGQRPDRYGSNKRVVATCIYRPSAYTFECHGGSSDGTCGQTSDGYGAHGYGTSDISSSLARCLTGEKWSGTYTGGIY